MVSKFSIQSNVNHSSVYRTVDIKSIMRVNQADRFRRQTCRLQGFNYFFYLL